MKRQPLILCIDSNADACEIMQILMERIGFQVVTSHNAQDALKLAQNNNFSVIISEYLLADADALHLCSEIKRLDPHVPIVFYSTESRTEHQARGLSAGANAFLVKPNDLDHIEKTVQELALV
jgi:two-component system response regulator PilR (NtrC family)